MLRLITQTKSKYKSRKTAHEEDLTDEERSEQACGSENERSTEDDHDQDSDLSFGSDSESEKHQKEEEDEGWIDYMKRSTKDVEAKMQTLRYRSLG